jgi:hypothetical protein
MTRSNARVLLMLHQRDDQLIPPSVETLMKEVHAEGTRIYAAALAADQKPATT